MVHQPDKTTGTRAVHLCGRANRFASTVRERGAGFRWPLLTVTAGPFAIASNKLLRERKTNFVTKQCGVQLLEPKLISNRVDSVQRQATFFCDTDRIGYSKIVQVITIPLAFFEPIGCARHGHLSLKQFQSAFYGSDIRRFTKTFLPGCVILATSEKEWKGSNRCSITIIATVQSNSPSPNG